MGEEQAVSGGVAGFSMARIQSGEELTDLDALDDSTARLRIGASERSGLANAGDVLEHRSSSELLASSQFR